MLIKGDKEADQALDRKKKKLEDADKAAKSFNVSLGGTGGIIAAVTQKASSFASGMGGGFSLFGGLLSKVNDSLGQLIGGVGSALGGVVGAIGHVAGFALQTLGGAFLAIPKLIIGGIGEALGQITGLAQKVFAVGGAAIGYFVHRALEGTVEGERLAFAFDRLSRAVGGIFMPYIRQLTTAIQQLTVWFQQLSPSLKMNVAQISLLVVGGAGLVTVFGFIVSQVMALLNPVTLLAAGLGYLLGKFLLAGTEGMSWSDKLTVAFDKVLTGWDYLMATMQVGWANFGAIMETTGDFLRGTLLNLAKDFQIFCDLIVAEAQLAGNKIGKSFGNVLGKTFLGQGKAFLDDQRVEQNRQAAWAALGRQVQGDLTKGAGGFAQRIAAIFDGAFEGIGQKGGRAAGLLGQLKQFMNGMGNGSLSAALKVDVRFESLTGTWERLQTAALQESMSALQLQQQNNNILGDIAKNIGMMAQSGVKVRGLAPVVGA